MDWWVTVIIAAVSAVAGAFIGGFLPIWIGEKWLRPKLEMKEESIVLFGEFGYGHRLLVKNTGRSAALNCIGMITIYNVAPQEDVSDALIYLLPNAPDSRVQTRPVMTKNFFTKIQDMPVCWAWSGNAQSIVINRDTPQALDVYRVQVDPNLLDIPTERGWQPFRVALRADKKYEGVIKVTSANAKPAVAKFELLPQENGDVKLNITERS